MIKSFKPAAAVLTFAIALSAAIYSVPSPTETASVSVLVSQSEIRRDKYGVPHILAQTEEAAAFALGYAQAEDHLLTIVRRFLSARGEEARYYGEDVENDFKMKRYGNYEGAKEKFGQLTPIFQKVLNGFAAGVNYYVERHRAELPDWIPPFDGVDVLARSRAEVFRFAFQENVITDIQKKYPSQSAKFLHEPSGRPRAVEVGDDFMGSNAWAIAPSRTTSGNAILMSNPHQGWSALYWEAHVTVPGVLNLFGNTFVGLPVLRHGFNERLGWTHTTARVDLIDVYALKRDSEKANHYIFDGVSKPMTKKDHTVQVKSKDGLRSETRTYWYSHLGPVVHETQDKIFAAKSPTLDEFRYFEEWYELGKAKNLTEFKTVLEKNAIPMFNTLYADVDGNTFFIWVATVPKRVDDGTDYRLDVPGDTAEYVWSSIHPITDLPQLLNPKGGYLQNSNDAPWYVSLRDRISPNSYPSYLQVPEGGPLSLRSQLSLLMLEGQEKFSIEDVQRLKFNTKMLVADRVKPALIEAAERASNLSEPLRSGLAALRKWDNRVLAESRGAVLFQRFWDTYRVEVAQPYAVDWDPAKPVETPIGLSDSQKAVKHLEDAVLWTRQKFGSENVAWGDVHGIELGNLDLPADGSSGAYGSFRSVQYGEAPDGKRVIGTVNPDGPLVGGGDCWVFLVEFSMPIKAYSLLAYGQTTNPDSKHSTDQVPLFAKHQLKPAWFSEGDIKANLESSYRPGEESPNK